ncbi:unnamed protein product [Eruca vesicaria subsp. sativa]|uniref:RIN4 pathogenic type III effector avirulence factor Avr cleavage site domain-containing protein n=1 Tax=Eruca vesicaria subsp. sativa TaxID=29727 RepID=A0ABC8IVP8_ERUVS|nr:unnamed protein product [Eruca vesicaria subsp. sativa]
MAEKDLPLPKFGEWDVNDPSSAEGFTVIFNKARNEKKGGGGGVSDSPGKDEPGYNKTGHALGNGKPTSYCVKKTGACLRSHDSHLWILVGVVSEWCVLVILVWCKEDECI